jgi:hypothetical protein
MHTFPLFFKDLEVSQGLRAEGAAEAVNVFFIVIKNEFNQVSGF